MGDMCCDKPDTEYKWITTGNGVNIAYQKIKYCLKHFLRDFDYSESTWKSLICEGDEEVPREKRYRRPGR